MTPEEYSAQLEALNETLVRGDIIDNTILPAGQDFLLAIKKRIKSGRDSNDKSIGEYSRKAAYFSKSQFIKGGFAARGKRFTASNVTLGDNLVPSRLLKSGKTPKKEKLYKTYTAVKDNNKERTSMYLPEGYKELRDIQGLQTAVVDEYYRGDLINGYLCERDGNVVLVGFIASQELKRVGQENHFKTNIFSATNAEIEAYKVEATTSIVRLTRTYLTSSFAGIV